jgi:mono/diheme cytochrome c family protein
MKALSLSRFAVVALAALGIAAVISADLNAEDAKPDEWKAPARASRKKNPIAPDEKSISRGEVVYVKECLSCHGKDGKGDGPASVDLNPKPRDLHTPKVWEQTDGSIFWKLTEGRKPMPSYEKLLSEDDRWHVINYLHKYAPSGSGGAKQP